MAESEAVREVLPETAKLQALAESMTRERVFIGRCDSYDPAAIAGVIRRGLDALGAEIPSGRITIKPNVVFAHHIHARHCYTRPEFMEGLLEVIGPGRERTVNIVEKSGAGAPTARMFARAGYRRLRRPGVRLHAAEEEPKVAIPVPGGKVHQKLHVHPDLVDHDFLIFTPKLKTNVLADGMTAALKLNIGSVDDRERMHGHDWRLDEKIVDILGIVHPQLIVTDAIEMAAGGNQMTERGYHLGAIIMATNPVAHDIVAASILGHDPAGIGHLQAAWRRGYRPRALTEVEVVGDTTVAELRQRVAGFDLGVYRIDQFPAVAAARGYPVNIRFVRGDPFCPGGCHGIFLDWLFMLLDRQPHKLKQIPPLTVVLSRTDEEITADRVLLLGNCAARSPHVRARQVKRIGGCPPSHRTIILWMAIHYGVLAPFFRPELIVDSYGYGTYARLKGAVVNAWWHWRHPGWTPPHRPTAGVHVPS